MKINVSVSQSIFMWKMWTLLKFNDNVGEESIAKKKIFSFNIESVCVHVCVYIYIITYIITYKIKQ